MLGGNEPSIKIKNIKKTIMNNLDFLRKSRKKKNIQIEMKNKILNKKNLIKTAYDIQKGDYFKFYNNNKNN